MQCARAIPVTWLSSGSCQPGLKGWILMNEWMNLILRSTPPSFPKKNYEYPPATNSDCFPKHSPILFLNDADCILCVRLRISIIFIFKMAGTLIIYHWPMSPIMMKKVKSSRYRPVVSQRVGRGIALLFHDRGTRRWCVVSSTPRPHFTPGKDPVPIVQEAGWAPEPVWTGGKSRPHRDSIPDRPARNQSLYRLSYPAHPNKNKILQLHYKHCKYYKQYWR